MSITCKCVDLFRMQHLSAHPVPHKKFIDFKLICIGVLLQFGCKWKQLLFISTLYMSGRDIIRYSWQNNEHIAQTQKCPSIYLRCPLDKFIAHSLRSILHNEKVLAAFIITCPFTNQKPTSTSICKNTYWWTFLNEMLNDIGQCLLIKHLQPLYRNMPIEV
jgi:hypothetical protein